MKKGIALLGSTGSIGRSALKVIEAAPDRFHAVALAAGKNIDLLADQVLRHRPSLVSVTDPQDAEELKKRLGRNAPSVVSGPQGLETAATLEEARLVLIAVSGAAGLLPALKAAQAGKTIALANKECLVMAGRLIMETARKNRATILPVDSEHSALFQALAGRSREEVRRVILPASGGPFLHAAPEELEKVSAEQAVAHPTWPMGKKISVDSATMMNKALEIIEARWLFDLSPEQIQVLIHPQAVVHGMVEFVDGSVIAQMSVPDMRLPILHALSWPERIDADLPRLDLAETRELSFLPLDPERFPAPSLAYAALEKGGTAPCVLAAADEAAVEAFLEGRIPFTRIVPLAGEALRAHKPRSELDLEEIMKADAWARAEVEKRIG